MKTISLSIAAILLISFAAVEGAKIGLDSLKAQAHTTHTQKTAKMNGQMNALLAQL